MKTLASAPLAFPGYALDCIYVDVYMAVWDGWGTRRQPPLPTWKNLSKFKIILALFWQFYHSDQVYHSEDFFLEETLFSLGKTLNFAKSMSKWPNFYNFYVKFGNLIRDIWESDKILSLPSTQGLRQEFRIRLLQKFSRGLLNC